MSKLNEIFDAYRKDCFLAKDAGLNESAIKLMAYSNITNKQKVKDQMLEIIGEDESEIPEVNPAYYGALIRNAQRAIMRQEVKQL